MDAMFSQFDMRGRIGRTAFWVGWGVHFLLSCALIAAFVAVDIRWPGGAAVFVVAGLRLLLIGPQVSLYVRRLRDGGHPGRYVFVLLGIYAVMVAIIAYWMPAALDDARECRETGSSGCGEPASAMIALAAIGPVTGLPGPFSLLFAIAVGTAKSKRPSGG